MIQFISHYNDRYDYLGSIRVALDGGCRWVQLRMKDCPVEEIRPVAIEAQRMCKEKGATFIIDDHVELVREIHADGVHLGKNDMPISEARKILGEEYIIGGTANTYDDIVRHYNDGANYIGCGPFRFTTTKKGLAPVLGIYGYRDIVARMKAAGIDIPMVAIGGITLDDVADIIGTGITGIALSGAVLNAENPAEEMRLFVEKLKQKQ